MYPLAPEAGDRWALPIITNESSETRLFQRYIQSVERTVDLISFRLRELLDYDYDYRKRHGEALWLYELGTISCFLDDEGTTAMAGSAADSYEGMVIFYDLYAEACREMAKAIDDFRDGSGTATRMQEAFAVLRAHNNTRDSYLEKIEFPAWV